MWKVTIDKISTVNSIFPHQNSFFRNLWNLCLYGKKVIIPGKLNINQLLDLKDFNYKEFDSFESALSFLICESSGVERDYTVDEVVFKHSNIIFSDEVLDKKLCEISRPNKIWDRYAESQDIDKKISERSIDSFKTLIYVDCYGVLRDIDLKKLKQTKEKSKKSVS